MYSVGKLTIAYTIIIVFLLHSFISCKRNVDLGKETAETDSKEVLFEKVLVATSEVDFVNVLEETTTTNYFSYMYLYIGGGIAVGDINNDGLVDLYFTSSLSPDKLYLNKGDFKFEDITKKVGIEHVPGFNTGVTFADVNNDGFLDIYVSRGGWKNEENFTNLLYINNGDLTFTEKAREFGLADANRTIQTTFFDYDNDNDLDAYVSNAPIGSATTSSTLPLQVFYNNPSTLKTKGCDRFYENIGNGHFEDVSEKVGLVYDLSYGLNPMVADLNGDEWLDVYVSSDFNGPDLVYINNGDKTFKEEGSKLFKHMSFNSMGSDFADINNDGLPDLMTLDMNPKDYIRSKTTMAMTPLHKFENMVSNGYHYQYMHNMLQVNNGNGTFSEIGNLSGIANTDWSWSLLLADFDLDGYNDVYVTNGVFRDVIDRDSSKEINKNWGINGQGPSAEEKLTYSKMLPQQKLTNFFFKNKGNLTFEDMSKSWVDAEPTFSNGSTYADLDNDGDLDIIVNNINEPATLLKNNAVEYNRGNFVKLNFKGPKTNPFGVGVKAKLYLKDSTSMLRRLINTKGFLSSVSNTLHFGFEKNKVIDYLEVVWPDGKIQKLDDISANETLAISYSEAKNQLKQEKQNCQMFTKLDALSKHNDTYFNDFDLQVLLPNKLSQTGPFASKADVNNDGLIDFYIGGAKNQSGQLFLGTNNGAFQEILVEDFNNDKHFEDQGVLFVDVDQDNDKDLYVISGSYEFYKQPEALQDRLYINDGKGNFKRAISSIPEIKVSGSVVVSGDYDNDGDLDLFVGGRLVPGKYPLAPTSYILKNNEGVFEIVTPLVAQDLENIGMITDASWVDINKDGLLDLIVAGEWMGIEIFENDGEKLVRKEKYKEMSEHSGWWNSILVEDIDADGDLDIVAGNLGLNSKFHASKENPFKIYTKDFDGNGSEDVLLAKTYDGKEVPIRGKTCMTQQLPYLDKRIKSYHDFANRDLQGIIGKDLEESLHYSVVEFRSGIFVNKGNGVFDFNPFDYTVQRSPINTILHEDLDKDGIKDLVLAGNNHMAEIETTRYDAGIGSFLKGDGKGGFKFVPNLDTGLFLDGDVRDVISIKQGINTFLIVINNNNTHDLYKLN